VDLIISAATLPCRAVDGNLVLDLRRSLDEEDG
jgi:hypothetical protein